MFINNLNPSILKIGFIEVRWYSLAYIFGILIGFYYAKSLIKKYWFQDNINSHTFDNFLSYAILGIILGGRFGYIVFYNFNYYFNNPTKIFYIWEGGMSFHGGVIGIIVATALFAKKNKIKFLNLTDITCCVAPIGIFLGRIANFINGELYGKKTLNNYGVIFPKIDMEPRHPSQLYEALLEGVLLFLILNITLKYKKKLFKGEISCYFLTIYSIFRIFSEFFREPDTQIGYIYSFFSLGMILSIIYLIIGLISFAILKNESFK
jgi:phosphatidylglycerol---prolipoprotein diacylglyceryl transferase